MALEVEAPLVQFEQLGQVRNFVRNAQSNDGYQTANRRQKKSSRHGGLRNEAGSVRRPCAGGDNAAMERYRVGIVGATGLVGQRLVQRLEGHPWFELVAVAACERSAGKTYAEATTWRLPTPMPSGRGAPRRPVRPGDLDGCDVVLSGLDAATAARSSRPSRLTGSRS